MRFYLVLAFFLIFRISAATAQNLDDEKVKLYLKQPSVNIPLNHFVYEWIERLEAKGVVPTSIEWRNKPYTRNAVLKLILTLDTKLKDHPEWLTRTEFDLFRKLKGEFHFELKQLASDVAEAEVEKHLLHFEDTADEPSYVIGDALFNQSFELTRYNSKEDSLDDNISFTGVLGRARGVVKNSIAFYSEFTSTLIRGSDRKYSFGELEQSGGNINYNPASKNVYSLEANAYTVIQPKWMRLQFGKDGLSLGPAKRGNLLLSDNAPPFDNLRMDVSFDRIKFTYLHGWLRSDPYEINSAGKISEKKYFVAHRLEFKIFPWLFVAGNESVVYGGRGVQVAYLNPITVYHITEQYLGDKDNNTISFDATAFPLKNIKAYASLYLDDFTSSRNPFTYWKQTWAFQFGTYWVEPFQLRDLDFRFEYSRIEPFVYAHKWDLINYTHFGKGLGSFLQPNSDDYFFEFRYRPARRYNIAVNYELTRHGTGDIYRFGYEEGFVDLPPGKQKKHFLQGINERRNALGLNLQVETFRNHYFFAIVNYSHTANYQNTKGRTLIQNRLLVGYKLDY